MRVSPISWISWNESRVRTVAACSAGVTHNHPEGVKGAQAAALAGCWLRNGCRSLDVLADMRTQFGYKFPKFEKIRAEYKFDATCQGSVPHAITAGVMAGYFEVALQYAISLGGDSDTLACIAGGIAGTHCRIPEELLEFAKSKLPGEMIDIVEKFKNMFLPDYPDFDPPVNPYAAYDPDEYEED